MTQTDSEISHEFTQLLTHLRSLPPTSLPTPLRLQLYGYYKVATGSPIGPQSRFDPVRRAKHEAHVEAMKECGGNNVVGMQRYIDAVRGAGLIQVEEATMVVEKSIVEKSKKLERRFELVPRGRLDIDWNDMMMALLWCIASTRRRHDDISRQWLQTMKEDTMTSRAVVGLSVRTVLDLYLSVKSYPDGSEVVLVPGVTIQGMLDVMDHHGIMVVPVDILEDTSAGDGKADDGRTFDQSKNALWGIDVSAVKYALSKYTVAIFVVHPFGTVVDDSTMMKLRTLADQHGIQLWEDRAQSYSGEPPSKLADVSFFSFGPIKTATALGGGVVVLRVPDGSRKYESVNNWDGVECHEQMTRIQSGYRQQSISSFFIRVIKCLVIHAVSYSRVGCGCVRALIEAIGWDYDTFVVHSLRGFSAGDASVESGARRQKLLKQLRLRPCPASLALLYRRILHSEDTARLTDDRMNSCRSFERRLLHDIQSHEDGTISLPRSVTGSGMYGWIFPVLVNEPRRVSKTLLELGYDAPCGLTQLIPVGNCRRLRSVFDHILYLPVPSGQFSEDDEMRLIEALKFATMNRDASRTNCPYRYSFAIIPVWTLYWWYSFISFPVNVTLLLIFGVARWILSAIAVVLLLLLLLSRTMGSVYLESSDTFAKYSDLVFRSPFHDECSNDNDARPDRDDASSQSKTALEMEFTRIPETESSGRTIGDNSRIALVTGATGFIGSLLLRELLLHRQSLSLGGVAVIVRSKKGASSEERVMRLLSQTMFDFLNEEEKTTLVRVIEGDVTHPDCGMTQQQITSISEWNISHVFHCAAAVSFSQTLEDAAVSNITSSLQLQLLTCRFSNRTAKFVYISTAFVHGGNTGTKSEPLPQTLFPLHPFDPLELYESMLGTQSYASAALHELGFPNTYTFSKCICEHLLLANRDVPTIIIRPSIVGPSVQEPYEGWAGEKPSTIVAAACLYLKFPYNMWCFGNELVPFVPVDVMCRCVISASFGDGENTVDECEIVSFFEGRDEEKKESNNCYETRISRPAIISVAWDASSPTRSSFSWVSYAFAITHLGSVCGEVNRVVAYAGLLLSTKIFPRLKLPRVTFQRLHTMFIRGPVDALLSLCERRNITTAVARDLKSLSPFLDLPMLFFPYANQNFYFRSDLVAPSDFNGERYMFSCAVAARQFISMIESRSNGNVENDCKTNVKVYPGRKVSCLVIGGSNHSKPVSDMWWALTQPKGNLFIRFGGWILAKIFRLTAQEIEVDVASLVSLARLLAKSLECSQPHVIIAPTHRSFYDFLILSFICFSYPELGIDIPFIAAADDFENIPVIGWLAKGAQAFFLKRGGKKIDPSLKCNLDSIAKGRRTSPFIEVFIEGKRSRYRTFSPPKTGFLQCLAESGTQCVILPVTINYEGLPDQASLMEQANHGSDTTMSLSNLSRWLFGVLTGTVKIGRVFVSAGGVVDMPVGCTMNSLCQIIQRHQQSRVLVSDFHIEAASLALDLPTEVITRALEDLRVRFWPVLENATVHSSPPTKDFQWAAMLHFGHVFAPFFASSHPIWSSWLCPSGLRNGRPVESSDATKAIVAKLGMQFEAAEGSVEGVLTILHSRGFHDPDKHHIMQYLPNTSPIPPFLMRVAIQIKPRPISSCVERNEPDKSARSLVRKSLMAEPLFHPAAFSDPDSESLGAWGYTDSFFVLNVWPDGSKCVVMKGNRYSISGKPLPRLVKFIEDKLNVKINLHHSTFPMRSNLDFVANSILSDADLSQLGAIFDDKSTQVSTESQERARHGTGHAHEDMFGLRTGYLTSRVPDAVVWPKSTIDIQSLISLAIIRDWCLIPFGGGTNVTHATHCPDLSCDPRPMISVDMRSMNRVLWVNGEDGFAHVEAGITGRQLVEHFQKLGFTIGHEPDSYEFSTLGGWIATKASGMKQNKYGNIEDIVKEVTVVGANGVLSDLHPTQKTSFGRVSTGIDLKSFVLGSEGCFGIIVSAVIKCWPLAETISYESVLLPDIHAGLRFAKELSKTRMKPASVRLLDNDHLRLGQALQEESSRLVSARNAISKQIIGYVCGLSDKSVVCAIITFEGSYSEVRVQKKIVRGIAASHGGILSGPALGKAGYNLTFAIAYLRDFALNYRILGESFESFVPWSKMQRVIDATKKRIYSEHSRRSLPGLPFVCCRLTQLYDEGACIYFYFCMNINGVPDPSKAFASIEACARQEILDSGGSLSHHHGLGKLRAPFIRQIYSEGYVDSMLAVKNGLDPNNIFGARNGIFFLQKSRS